MEAQRRNEILDTDSAILDDLMESRTEIRDWLECPICLGIIKKARTVVDCMHRFCTECIEQVLEKGMHDCPVCCLHIPSGSSLKADPLFDGLVEAICQVILKSRNEAPKSISPSSSKQQAKRKLGGENNNLQSTELQEFDNNEQTAPTDECGKQTKVRRIIGGPSNQTSPPILATNSKGKEVENSTKIIKDNPALKPISRHHETLRGDEMSDDSSVEYIGCTDLTLEYLRSSRIIRHVSDEELSDNSADSHASLRPVSGHEKVSFERGETSGKIFDLHEETRVGMAERIMESKVLPEVRTHARELPIEEQDSICSNVYRCIVPYLEVLYLLEEKEGELKKKEEENSSLHDSQVIADLIISEAQTGGWKMWYKSLAEYKRDLKDAVSIYYKIGKLTMKKKICEIILDFCPSFEPSKFNLDLSKVQP